MTRGSLRFTEEQWREHEAKCARFNAQHVTVLRPPDHSSRAPLPARGAPSASPISKPVAKMQLAEAITSRGHTTAPEVCNRQSKYRNKPTNGYASIKESKRAFQLKLMQEAGQIRNLREQVEYLLIPKQEGERACSYIADFVYEEYGQRAHECGYWPVVEDVKSPASRTDAYIMKRKLMLFVHNIRIRET